MTKQPIDENRQLQDALLHHQAGRLAEARAGYEAILAADTGNVDALHFLGVLAYQEGRHETAEALIMKALEANASNAPAQNNLGNVLAARGRLAEARSRYRRAIELQTGYLDAYANLAAAAKQERDLDEAEASYRKAVALMPAAPALHFALGNVLAERGKHEEAIVCYRQASTLDPRLPEPFSNLGNVLRDGGRLAEALECYEKAVALRPDFPEALYNLGNVLKDVGRLSEAVQTYRRAMSLAPDDAQIHSNLLVALNYTPGLRPAEIFAEHRAYGRRFAAARDSRPFANSPEPARRLRVGYMSGDLRTHPVAQFIEPVLAQHDRSSYEIFCYYNYPKADAVTARLRSYANAWRDVFSLPDDSLAELIRDDAIDVLIDLSGHTAEHRLPVLARKPAPVQATWLGYLNTTGLDAMDYRISDWHATPESFEPLHAERVIRLPHSQWCYRAPPGCPEVSPAPCEKAGRVTYGAFSNLAKIGPPVVELWCALLRRVPDSRLLVMGPGLRSIGAEFLARFTRHGVEPSRIELQESKPLLEYLDAHRAVDIMLDTFPYAGGTTTCHALWMGVPVVTIVGDAVASRGGASVLRWLGLDRLIAANSDDYLAIASRLAAEPRKLGSLRSEMRTRMRRSPLTDAVRYTRDVEALYRTIWTDWCLNRRERRAL